MRPELLDYLADLFDREDPDLQPIRDTAARHSLPDIAVSPHVGRLLFILASLAARGTDNPVALELGTLAGYSAACIARGLGPAGTLHTVEPDPRHARIARDSFRALGLDDRIRIIPQPALDCLPDLRARLGDASLDLAFIDAVKSEYPRYLDHVLPMLRPGALLVADNALGGASWSPLDDSDPARAVREFNRRLAADPSLRSVCIPIRQGVLVALKLP